MYSRQLLFKCVHVDYISLYDTACNGIVWSAIFILCVVRFLGEIQTQISLYIYDPAGLGIDFTVALELISVATGVWHICILRRL